MLRIARDGGENGGFIKWEVLALVYIHIILSGGNYILVGVKISPLHIAQIIDAKHVF